MSIKHLCDDTVQVSQNYCIRNDDKTVLAVACPCGRCSEGPIHLALPKCPHRGQSVTVVAVDIDVVIDDPFPLPAGFRVNFIFTGQGDGPNFFNGWQVDKTPISNLVFGEGHNLADPETIGPNNPVIFKSYVNTSGMGPNNVATDKFTILVEGTYLVTYGINGTPFAAGSDNPDTTVAIAFAAFVNGNEIARSVALGPPMGPAGAFTSAHTSFLIALSVNDVLEIRNITASSILGPEVIRLQSPSGAYLVITQVTP